MDQSMQIGGQLLYFNRPLTMGIINLTADSFYAGSRAEELSSVLSIASEMLTAGADILDLGAYSTRPGASDIPEAEELKSLLPAIETIRMNLPQSIISVDTFRSAVAEACILAGAHLINDVGSGILDSKMFDTAAKLGVPYILTHNRGMPDKMQKLATYGDVVDEVIKELSGKVNDLRSRGVADLIVDPGFGFAKNVEQNFEMLRRLDEFKVLGCPVLAGVSRKSMIWRTLNIGPAEALNGTTALHMLALTKGADILRVHDVKEARETILLWRKCNENFKTKLDSSRFFNHGVL